MAIVKHDIAVLDGSNPMFTDRAIVGVMTGVANASGTAGATVATVVTFLEPLPAGYVAMVQPNQDAVAYISARTTNGFTVNLTPRLAANALAAGTFDLLVMA